jgi:hypothetical protein
VPARLPPSAPWRHARHLRRWVTTASDGLADKCFLVWRELHFHRLQLDACVKPCQHEGRGEACAAQFCVQGVSSDRRGLRRAEIANCIFQTPDLKDRGGEKVGQRSFRNIGTKALDSCALAAIGRRWGRAR